MNKKTHWEGVYQSKKMDEVSWYQARPELSLRMIEVAKLPLDAPLIDVGGGASRLVDHLIELGYRSVLFGPGIRLVAPSKLRKCCSLIHWRSTPLHVAAWQCGPLDHRKP